MTNFRQGVLYAVGMCLLLAGGSASAATINVPANQPTIQAGINAAQTGDTVLVAPGTYYENINFLGKAITVTSSGGAASTVIDGSGIANSIPVRFATSETTASVLSGFTITHAGTGGDGIYIFKASPTIQNNIITANACLGVWVDGGSPMIQANDITNTLADPASTCPFSGTGIYLDGFVSNGLQGAMFLNNVVEGNLAGNTAGGVLLYQADGIVIENNFIRNNSSNGGAGGLAATHTLQATIVQNLIYGNSNTAGGVGAGGVYLAMPASTVSSGIVFADNTIANNSNAGPHSSAAQASEVAVDGSASLISFTNNVISGSSAFPAFSCANDTTSSPSYDHNDVYNTTGLGFDTNCLNPTGTSGNISANPLFDSLPFSNFHLEPGSPAIDAGTPGAPLISNDIDGNPRVLNGTNLPTAIIDIGAYEFVPDPAINGTTLIITSGGSAVTTVAHSSVVTLTATVVSSGNPVTTGQVNFCDATAAHCTDIHLLGTAQLTSAGTATMKFVPGIGTHIYKAVYAGTNAIGGSSSDNASLTVTGLYPTTTTIVSSGTPGNYTLTATVTGDGPVTPTGTVPFLDTTNGNSVLATAALVPGTSALNFVNSANPAIAAQSFFGASGDFNGDGIPDLAVGNSRDPSSPMTILLGNGDGTFSTGASPAAVETPQSITVGDFNGDGKADLAVGNFNSDTVTILLGNGDGTFTPVAATSATGFEPVAIATGDFNGDGNADLVVGNEGNSLTVLLGNGDGTFAASTIAITGNMGSITTGDFNGDGKTDLAVANPAGIVLILLGNGDGTFSTPASIPVGSQPRYVAAGDFNGDGNLDLAVANLASNTLSILLGDGHGGFTVAASPATGRNPSAVAVGDFNGDGKADLAVTNINGNSVTILLGNGDGTFTTAATPATSSTPISVVAADFNGDGLSDIAVVNEANAGDTANILLSQQTYTATATVHNIAVVGNGTHLVDASYPGDTVYAPSISPAIPLDALGTTTPVMSLTTNPSSSEYSGSFSLIATLVPPSGSSSIPSGTVTFSIDGVQVGSPVTLTSVGGVMTATYTVPYGNTYSISGSPHTVVATYSGDSNFTASTQTVQHFITLIATTTTLYYSGPGCGVHSPPPGSIYYYAEDFETCTTASNTDTINPAIPAGTIDFNIDNTPNCVLQIGGAGCSGPNPDAGAHQMQAVYLGDTHHTGSSSPLVPLTVLQDPTATSVTSTTFSPFQGMAITLTATVTAIAPGNYAPPVGPVSFYDGTTLIGTGTLVPNPGGAFFSTATFVTSTLSVGAHVITANYATTLDFLGSVSIQETLTVLPLAALPSTVTLTSSLPTSTFGQTVSFTAAIAVHPPPGNTQPLPTGPPTGTVTFYDGATMLGISGVGSGASATFNTASLAVGSHVITAQYSGDGSYLAGASNTVLQVVNPLYNGPPDFTLTIAQNPFVVGVGLVSSVAVTVTATNGWTNDVTLACPSSLPYDTTCTLQQMTIPGGNGHTTLTMSTTAPHSCGSNTPYFTGTAQLEMRLGAATLAGLVMFMLPRRRRVLKGLLLALLCILPGIAGCAGTCTDLGTRPGTYSIPITATGAGTTHTVNLQVQVNL